MLIKSSRKTAPIRRHPKGPASRWHVKVWRRRHAAVLLLSLFTIRGVWAGEPSPDATGAQSSVPERSGGVQQSGDAGATTIVNGSPAMDAMILLPSGRIIVLPPRSSLDAADLVPLDAAGNRVIAFAGRVSSESHDVVLAATSVGPGERVIWSSELAGAWILPPSIIDGLSRFGIDGSDGLPALPEREVDPAIRELLDRRAAREQGRAAGTHLPFDDTLIGVRHENLRVVGSGRVVVDRREHPVLTTWFGMRMRWIRPATMAIAKDESLPDTQYDRVTVSKGFWIAVTELTEAQGALIEGGVDGALAVADDRRQLPIAEATWARAARIADAVSGRRPDDGVPLERETEGFTLPSVAQWMLACGGPSLREGNWRSPTFNEQAWTFENSGDKLHPVATRKANWAGLHDMNGSVAEWCLDYWARKMPTGLDPVVREPSVFALSQRSYRGGYYGDPSHYCDCRAASFAAKHFDDPATLPRPLGVRLVLVGTGDPQLALDRR